MFVGAPGLFELLIIAVLVLVVVVVPAIVIVLVVFFAIRAGRNADRPVQTCPQCETHIRGRPMEHCPNCGAALGGPRKDTSEHE